MSSLSASCLEVSSLNADLQSGSATPQRVHTPSIAFWPRELWDSEVILRLRLSLRILFVIAPLLGLRTSQNQGTWKTASCSQASSAKTSREASALRARVLTWKTASSLRVAVRS